MPSVAVSALIKDSLMEIGVLAGGANPSPDQADFCVGRLNQVFDNYNAMREASYVERFDTFTFIPNQQDYTLGPASDSPDFVIVNARPTAIDAANVILNNVNPTVRNPINIRDWQWWAGVSVRDVHTTFPTDLYYEANWPSGILKVWPVPTAAYGLEIVTTNTFGQVTVTDTINFPSGYHAAIMLTLAEDLASPFGQTLLPLTSTKAREARARIFAMNEFSPRLRTQDAGMPSNSRNRASFNYRTGLDMNTNR